MTDLQTITSVLYFNGDTNTWWGGGTQDKLKFLLIGCRRAKHEPAERNRRIGGGGRKVGAHHEVSTTGMCRT